jgi:hypothetical protein
VDGVIGSLRAAGFSTEMAAHAFWVLDSYVYGHVIQETALPFPSTEPREHFDPQGDLGDEYPHLAEMAAHAATRGYDIDAEFGFGLDLILDALDRAAGTAG